MDGEYNLEVGNKIARRSLTHLPVDVGSKHSPIPIWPHPETDRQRSDARDGDRCHSLGERVRQVQVQVKIVVRHWKIHAQVKIVVRHWKIHVQVKIVV